MKRIMSVIKVSLFVAAICMASMSLMSQSATPAEAAFDVATEVTAEASGTPLGRCNYPGCIGGPTKCRNAPPQAQNRCFWWPFE